MTALQQQQRFDFLDFDVAPDEELPGYDASTAPAYDEVMYDGPLYTYHLRQYDRRIQMFVAHGPVEPSSYRVTSNSFRLFSKKPEMEVLYTSPELRQRNIANIAFDNDGPLPWRPRAHFDYTDCVGVATTHSMESMNFTDWTMELQGKAYAWSIDMRPVSLVFREQGSSFTIARFTYSAAGTWAVRGAEIGELAIFRDRLTIERKGVDWLVCGLMVPLMHLKRMGKQYSNGLNGPGTIRAHSVSTGRELEASRGMSSAGFSVL